MSDQLTVLQVAFQKGDLIYTMARPARHSTLMFVLDFPIPPWDQGFLLSDGTFCGRRRAYDVAFKAGQILPRQQGQYNGPELYSEDLW